MAIRTLILVLLAGTTALAGPLQNQPAECRRSCPLNDMSKFRYASGMTYEYEVESESLVEVKNIHGQQARVKWSATVDLHFDSPCEVTLQIKNPKLQGEANAAFEQQLSSYPMRAVMADGTFEDVCAHEDDVTSAVNIKKGILSQLQNTLPSNSTMFDGIQIPETDILGVCPTTYRVRHESGKVVVAKTKNHHLCSKRYGSSRETPLSAVLLKAPFPLIESTSTCKQEIEEGIVKSVECLDQNELSPMPGIQRTAKAQLQSKLTLKSVSSIKNVNSLDKSRKTNLLYDYTIFSRNSSASAKMESKLRELCATIEGKNVTKRTAELYSELIESMDHVEEHLISEMLKNIKSKKYCSPSAEKLAALYLDAVASTENTGALPLMVEELIKGSRQLQYTWRLHTFPRVCIHGIEAVMPLFEKQSLPVPTILAAGSVVARYCATEGAQTKSGCLQQEPVQQIMQTISAKIQHACPSTNADKSKRHTSVALLKAVANIRNATQEMRSTIFNCFQQSSAAMNVRIAAADTLRNIPCSGEITEKLLQEAKKSSLNTELRIFAYKAAVMCANTSQLTSLIDEVTQTSNHQVRSFILSDLTNLQLSQAPYKVAVRQRLARFNISQDYSQNVTSSSRSYEVSKFTQSGSYGAEVDYGLIFEGAGMIPRQIRTNFTVALFKEVINFLEMGVRAENLPGLLGNAVGADTTLGKTFPGEMMRKYLQTQTEASGNGQLELFVKLFGQEIFYSDLSDVDEAEHDMLVKVYQVAGEVYQEITSRTHLQSFQGFQSKCDLVIPTIQGLPLHVTKELSAVASVNATPSLQGLESSLEYAPVLSAMANLFVGYKFGPSAGLKINTTVFSSTDTIVRVQLDWPSAVNVKVEFPTEDAKLMEFEHNGYMMVKLPGQAEQVKESSNKDPRKQGKKCSLGLGGMQFCCDHDILDLWQDNDYPLVQKSHVKWSLKKENPSMKGLEFKFSKQENSQRYRTKLLIPGTQNPTKFDLELFYQSQQDSHVFSIESKAGQRPQGIKIVHRAGHGNDNEVEVFIGGQQSEHKVFSGKLALTTEGQMKVNVKTEGGLERLILADVDVDVTLGEPSQSWQQRRGSLQLRKFEVELAAARCKTQSYIRKTPGQGGASQFVSQVLLTCNERQILNTSISSTMQEQEQGLKLDSKLEVEHGSQRSEGDFALILNPSLKQLRVQVSSEGGSKILQLVASDQKDSAQGRKSLVAFEFPKANVAWKAVSQLKGSLSDGEVDISVSSLGREVLSIRGPISVTRTETEKKQSAQLGIRFGEQGTTYHVTNEMEFAKQRCHIKAIVNDEQKLLISYEHDFSGDGRPALSPEAQFSVVTKIEVPQIVKTDVNVRKTSSNIKTDAEVKLEVISSRHIEAYAAVDTSTSTEGHVSAKLLWDKARDPEKKVELSGTYSLQGNEHFETRGEIGYKNEKFHYAVSSLLKMHQPWPNMEKDMKIEVMKGSEEVFTIKNMLHIEAMSGGSLRVKSESHLLTPYKNEYSCKKELDVLRAPAESSVKLESALHASTVGVSRLSLSVSSKGGQAAAVAIQGKFEAIGVNQHEPALSARWEGDLEGNAEGGVEKVNIGVSVEADRQRIEIEASENAADMETRISIKKNGRSLVRGEVSRGQGNTLSAQIHMPSRSFVMSGRYDRHVKSLTVYPNKRQSDQKIGARFSDQSNKSGKELALVLDYPHNGRQKKVIGSFTSQKQHALGAIELDVFSEAGKALKVQINGTKISDDILRFEASIQSNSTADGPTVEVDMSMASQDMYIIAAYKKDSRSSPSVFISSKYVKQVAHSGVLSVLLITPETKVEMGGVVTSVNNYGCQGYQLNSTLQSDRSRKYDLEIETCSPAFIKIVTGLKEGSERYLAKLGMESLLHAELSLMKDTEKASNSWWSQMTGSAKERREVPVIAISAKLKRPTTLTLRAQYSKETLLSTMALAERELTATSEAASSMLLHMGRQISLDISEAYPELKQALDGIAESLVSLKEIPALKEVARQAADGLQYLIQLCDRAVELALEAFKKFRSDWGYIADRLLEVELLLFAYINDIVQSIQERIEEWIGPVEELHQKTVVEIEKFVQRVEQSSVGELITAWAQYLCEMYSSQCEYAQASFDDYVQELKRDLYKFSNLLLQDKSVQYTRSLIHRAIDMVYGNQFGKILQSLLLAVSKQNAGVYFDDSQLQVNLPLRQPVGSVLTAARQIGFAQSNQNNSHPEWRDFSSSRA